MAGAGTTTATVLAQAIVREGMRNIAAGADPMSLKRGLDHGTRTIVEELRGQARPVQDKAEIEAVATISADDPDVGVQIAEVMELIDVFITPSYGGYNLLLPNLTGHPAVCLPNGFKESGSPTSISFVGQLYGEADMLAVARVYQEATDFHLQHPVLER